MNKYQLLILIFLLLVFGLRVFAIGGFNPQAEKVEFEAVEGTFKPLRDFLASQSEKLLPSPQAELLSGMVLGVKQNLPKDFKDALTNTSTIHIVVVSGQNLTLLAGFILGFSGYLGRKKTVLLSLGVVIFYSFLTGLQVPVIRAALMVGFASLAQIFNREAEGKWILIFTALLMLIFNPNWLFSISFQLSFLATIGVMVVAPEVVRIFKEFRMPEIINQDLAVSLSAQLLTLPVIALNFHQISISGILVNSLILFTVPIIMISGALAILVSLINLTLGQILSLIPGIFLTYFVYVVEFFNQAWGSMEVWLNNIFIWMGYYLLIFSFYLYLRKRNLQNPKQVEFKYPLG